MPKISKVRIVNFEYNDGKRLIADELYDFANRDNDDALNVLINLANGGGKSVLVQLMMQPIIPRAKVAGRRIESFFTKPTDHCFILLEWQKDNSREKLLTGIAMAARASSAEDDQARGMSVKYYTFYSNYASDHSNYSIINLPLSKRENGRFIPADFEAVRTIAKRSSNTLVYYRDDDNAAWRWKLEEYGLVQNEWHTMEKLNSEEGGFGKFFGAFKTSDQLVDHLLIHTIEEKLGMSSSKNEDHSLSTMLLSYAKQYAEQQDVLRNKEIYESFIRGLQHLHPLAEALWNANDRLAEKIKTLFGLSDALSAKIGELQREQEQAAATLEQLELQKHHIEHEQASAEYYQKQDAFDEAQRKFEAAEAEKQELESAQSATKQQLLIQECAGYFGKLKTIDSEISALQAEIIRREQGETSDDALNVLQYSAACAVREALEVAEPKLASLREQQTDISRQLTQQETALKQARDAARKARSAYDNLTGRLESIRESTDRIVADLGCGLFRRIDGPYADEDLDEIHAEIEANRSQASTACNKAQERIIAITETLDTIPQKLADISAEILQAKQQGQSVQEALDKYHLREAAVQRICDAYNLDFSLRFTGSILEYLTSEQRNNASQQGELLRKNAVSEEEIHAAERGSVHVPNAVIEYLNSTGVAYNTCENYLLRLVDEQKITKQQCLDILRNYPAAAYGVLMDTKAKEDFFSFECEQWLPAMVPIFTHEQMRTILELKKSFSGSIAFYSKDSFADRANYISLLHSQRDQLSRRHVLLTETAKQIKRQIEDAEAFGYSAQCTSLADEMSRCRKQLAASEKQVSDELSTLQRQFQNTSCGVLDSVVSMTELLEKKLRGDRFFTLIDLIENSILNAQRAIVQIMTDLKEFEHHHYDLIYQCTLQGQRIYEGLKQMSASSRVTVYDGKPKKQMIRFDLPESIDPVTASAAISDEIDKGTKELVTLMSAELPSEQEISKLAKRIVSSRNLLRKYLRQESIGVSAFKIDQNPKNAGYRSWKQTQVNNSGAEKFIVYFAVILSLMSYTREDLGGIRDKELRSVLILDNPFGATSSRHILEPMFAIAKHFRVQMICLSDINKSDVINCFDIVIKAIVKKRPMSSSELLTHEGNELMDHGFYRAEQLSLL